VVAVAGELNRAAAHNTSQGTRRSILGEEPSETSQWTRSEAARSLVPAGGVSDVTMGDDGRREQRSCRNGGG